MPYNPHVQTGVANAIAFPARVILTAFHNTHFLKRLSSVLVPSAVVTMNEIGIFSFDTTSTCVRVNRSQPTASTLAVFQ